MLLNRSNVGLSLWVKNEERRRESGLSQDRTTHVRAFSFSIYFMSSRGSRI